MKPAPNDINVTRISVSCIVSGENTRGAIDKKGLADLAASIKEKGILVPLIVRLTKNDVYELVAGFRRLAAAKLVGLDMVPVNVMRLTDDEAREVQIIENLQRADVHPLEEGEAYRKLVEESNRELADVAAKVGKAVQYVKDRLVLTNLGEKQKTAYRAGKILHGHAQLIARLASVADQDKALAHAFSGWHLPSVKDLQEWIEEHVNSSLDNQPWLKLTGKDAEPFAAHAGCRPNVATLFGDVKEGACTSLACWQKKMSGYVAWLAVKHGAVTIAGEYGYGKMPKGIIGRDSYLLVGKGQSAKMCGSARRAVFATGPDIGRLTTVCIDGKCKTHRGETGAYSRSVGEQERRKKKKLADERKRTRENAEMAKMLVKVKWPMTEAVLDALLRLNVFNAGSDTLRPIAKRRGIEPIVKTQYGSKYRDYSAAVEAKAKTMTPAEKLGLLFETMYSGTWEAGRRGVAKLLKL